MCFISNKWSRDRGGHCTGCYLPIHLWERNRLKMGLQVQICGSGHRLVENKRSMEHLSSVMEYQLLKNKFVGPDNECAKVSLLWIC